MTGYPVKIWVGDPVTFDGFTVGEDVGPVGLKDGRDVGFEGFCVGTAVGPLGGTVGGSVGFLDIVGERDNNCTEGFGDGFDVGELVIVGYCVSAWPVGPRKKKKKKMKSEKSRVKTQRWKEKGKM